MAEGHEHVSEIKHEKPLWWAFGLTSVFLIAEIIGGLITNSLALLSDAAHMGTDVIALAISLFAVRMSRKPADAKRTYGFARMEAIGALVNGGMLFLVAGYILWEAVGRFRQPPDVASTGMLVIAALGLVVNLISMRLLKAGSGDSLNVKGAYLEVWADMLGSVGVIGGAIIIMMTGWTLADPIIAVLIGLWVLPRTWTLLRAAGGVLMQSVPAGMDLDKVRDMMLAHPGVAKVHDLHVWALGSKEPVLTAHIILDDETQQPDVVRQSLATALTAAFDIEHVTLQVDASTVVEGPTHA
ncbi:cation diffusion facilitator family transporter [Thermomonas sp.]|uniref:cation diffusion facilitator family transporter n=1 Tax=Thermomonas sp. TaxID=1971895 RepID=UPI0035AE832B